MFLTTEPPHQLGHLWPQMNRVSSLKGQEPPPGFLGPPCSTIGAQAARCPHPHLRPIPGRLHLRWDEPGQTAALSLARTSRDSSTHAWKPGRGILPECLRSLGRGFIPWRAGPSGSPPCHWAAVGEEWGAQRGGAWWLSKAEREKKTKNVLDPQIFSEQKKRFP